MTKIAHIDPKNFGIRLINWFEEYQRSLPWRNNRTWYTVWISEVMLQQTQVEKVLPYYTRFLKKFPTVEHLVAADLQTVLKLWEGMGYYARARNLYKAAHLIQQQYNGSLPGSEQAVRKLPGFGPYITNAVLSIAYNLPLAVVDGNVLRVISRLFKIKSDIRQTRVKKDIQKRMDKLIDHSRPGIFNEAIMELGATLCLPHNPLCTRCPVSEFCQAYRTGVEGDFPYKSSPAQKKTINSIALICFNNNKLLIAQRPDNGLLGGFWEFPIYNIPAGRTIEAITDSEIMHDIDTVAQHKFSILPITHTYSHFQLILYGRVYFVKTTRFLSTSYERFEWIKLEQINQYPIHRAMTKMLEKVNRLSEIITK